MKTIIIKRIMMFIPLLLGITLISFVIMHLTPGSPVDAVKMSPDVDTRAQERLYRSYGLDKPLHIQYINWLKRIIIMDFGNSFKDGRKVKEKIFERLPATILLNAVSLLFIFMLSFPIGIISALNHNKSIDRFLSFAVFLGYSVPTFVVALLLMNFFSVKMGIFPLSGMYSIDFEFMNIFEKTKDILWHLALPVITTSIGGLAFISRYLRSSLLEVINKDFVKALRSRGIGENAIMYKHVLRNAAIPMITLMGLLLPVLMSGSVIFETIFSWPGMGRLAYNAIMSRDYPVVMGVGVIMAFLTLLGNLIADIGYVLADPRIRYKK